MDITIEGGIELNDGQRIPRLAFGTFDLKDGDEAMSAVPCAVEGIDPENFAPYLNGLSSHF